jgi:hypothetical protein
MRTTAAVEQVYFRLDVRLGRLGGTGAQMGLNDGWVGSKQAIFLYKLVRACISVRVVTCRQSVKLMFSASAV